MNAGAMENCMASVLVAMMGRPAASKSNVAPSNFDWSHQFCCATFIACLFAHHDPADRTESTKIQLHWFVDKINNE